MSRTSPRVHARKEPHTDIAMCGAVSPYALAFGDDEIAPGFTGAFVNCANCLRQMRQKDAWLRSGAEDESGTVPLSPRVTYDYSQLDAEVEAVDTALTAAIEDETEPPEVTEARDKLRVKAGMESISSGSPPADQFPRLNTTRVPLRPGLRSVFDAADGPFPRGQFPRAPFPWFELVFPAMCFLAGLALGVAMASKQL